MKRNVSGQYLINEQRPGILLDIENPKKEIVYFNDEDTKMVMRSAVEEDYDDLVKNIRFSGSERRKLRRFLHSEEAWKEMQVLVKKTTAEPEYGETIGFINWGDNNILKIFVFAEKERLCSQAEAVVFMKKYCDFAKTIEFTKKESYRFYIIK